MRAYAVTYASREFYATEQGRRMVHDSLFDEVATLGSVVPLTDLITVDPFETAGDLDSPMSTPTIAVIKLACEVTP